MLLVSTQNEDIWNFYGSLTLNNRKPIEYFGSPWYAILLNRSYFLIWCSMKEKLCLFINYKCYLCQHKITQNQDIWNFYGSLTLNNGKRIWYLGSSWYAILLNRSHFWFCVARRRNCAFFELQMLPVPTQNQEIWNFYGSLTLNNGKLIWYFKNPWYAILLNRRHFWFCVAWERNSTFFEL